MWARIIEFMLACWLSISAFIFDYPKGATFFWVNDLTCAVLITFFSLVCYYNPLRKMHLCNLLISAYFIALSYFLKNSGPYAPLQNYMVLGILILMIAIVPSRASHSPKSWKDFYERK